MRFLTHQQVMFLDWNARPLKAHLDRFVDYLEANPCPWRGGKPQWNQEALRDYEMGEWITENAEERDAELARQYEARKP